jgi:hypothetical protein
MTSRKYRLILIFLFSVLTLGQAAGQDLTPGATAVMTGPPNGELYAPMTFTVQVDPATYTNPFDANDIEVLAVFQSPSNKQVVIPGFWMQPYANPCPPAGRTAQPEGDPVWQVRFTPQETGEWRYTIQARDNTEMLPGASGHFTVTPSNRHGFIRVGANKRYFQYQDGQPYFPIGHNLKWSWAEGGGLPKYLDWLKELGQSGGNYARLYMDEPWFIGLEWDKPAGDYRAAQEKAACLDRILDAAADDGVALQLVILWHQALASYSGPPVMAPDTFKRPDTSADWARNPYNFTQGGPLGSPGMFFTNDQAKALFRSRLRYIASRWGYSPQIFVWEMIDAIDRTNGYDDQSAGAWLRDAASYLKQVDAHGHLVTAGSATVNAPSLSQAPLDFTEAQYYQRRPVETAGDQVNGTLTLLRNLLDTTSTPMLLTAYSLNPWFEPTADDPQGIHFQETLWAAVLSGAAGGAVSDWPDTYIIPQGLERYYAPLRAFAAGVDWPRLDLQPAEAVLIGEGDYTAANFSSFNRQLPKTKVASVARAITPDGVFPRLDEATSYLFGRVYSNALNQPQEYHVVTSVDGYIEVRVRRVSDAAGARLSMKLDEQVPVTLDLAAGSKGAALRLPLPAGDHTIVLDNTGDDWLEMESLEVGALIAPARALTLRDVKAGIALAWVQHRDYTWEKSTQRPAPLTLCYRLDEMPPGIYRVEIWEPLTGAVPAEIRASVGSDGILAVSLPPTSSLLALRIFRMGDLPEATPTVAADMPLFATNTPHPK